MIIMERTRHILVLAAGATLILCGGVQLQRGVADEAAIVLAVASNTYGGACGQFCDGESN
jgi:hypothetical protein